MLKEFERNFYLIKNMEFLSKNNIDVVEKINSILYKEIILDRTHNIKIEENLHYKITERNLKHIIIKNTTNIHCGDLIIFSAENKFNSNKYRVVRAQVEPFVNKGYISLSFEEFKWDKIYY